MVTGAGVGPSGSRWEPAPAGAAPEAVGAQPEAASSRVPDRRRTPGARSLLAVAATLLVAVGLGGLVVGREAWPLEHPSPTGVAPVSDDDGSGEPGQGDDHDHDRAGADPGTSAEDAETEASGRDS